jgi:hypothetical protein
VEPFKNSVCCTVCVGESGRESADAVASILQKIQVNGEERDVAVRLLKTGGLSVAVSI